MASVYPTGLDALTNPIGTDLLDSATTELKHTIQHGNVNDAIEAVQAKVGITGSTLPATIDARVAANEAWRNRLGAGWASMPRWVLNSAAISMNSGSVRLSHFTADIAGLSTGIRVYSGTTAAGATPTLVRFGLYTINASGDGTLVASTANDTTLLAAASTQYLKAWSGSYSIVKNQRYALAAIVVTAAAAPTMAGCSVAIGQEMNVAPAVCNFIASQSDLPSSFLVGGTGTSVNWLYLVAT